MMIVPRHQRIRRWNDRWSDEFEHIHGRLIISLSKNKEDGVILAAVHSEDGLIYQRRAIGSIRNRRRASIRLADMLEHATRKARVMIGYETQVIDKKGTVEQAAPAGNSTARWNFTGRNSMTEF